jgi:Na+-driven multidrug efflux pump
MAPGVLAVSIAPVLGAWFSAQGKYLWGLKGSALGLAALAIADAILVPLYGPNGAAMGASIAHITSFGVMFYGFTSTTKTHWREFLITRTDVLGIKHILRQG